MLIGIEVGLIDRICVTGITVIFLCVPVRASSVLLPFYKASNPPIKQLHNLSSFIKL